MLSKQQLQVIRGAIEQRRARLEDEIRSDTARTREHSFGNLAGPTGDAGDESVAGLISDLEGAELTRDVQELRELGAAEERLIQGTYGECIACGIQIPFERLVAQPTAMRCVDCQAKHERTYAGSGEPTL